jgi:hypothetical protein
MILPDEIGSQHGLAACVAAPSGGHPRPARQPVHPARQAATFGHDAARAEA